MLNNITRSLRASFNFSLRASRKWLDLKRIAEYTKMAKRSLDVQNFKIVHDFTIIKNLLPPLSRSSNIGWGAEIRSWKFYPIQVWTDSQSIASWLTSKSFYLNLCITSVVLYLGINFVVLFWPSSDVSLYADSGTARFLIQHNGFHISVEQQGYENLVPCGKKVFPKLTALEWCTNSQSTLIRLDFREIIKHNKRGKPSLWSDFKW